MSDHEDTSDSVCAQCASASIVATGVFEHGTWIQRLTCWTCRDCRSVVVVLPEAEISTPS